MLRILCLIATFAFTAAAEQKRSAFEAYALVPREMALRLARVAACEGTPQPERWHFIVHDPGAENGLRDYVIAGGEVAAMNAVSQFAGEVRPEDVLALKSVYIDSSHVARVASQYGAANKVRIASMNYELNKESIGVLAWKVTCIDPANRPLGWLVIDAVNGEVIKQSGFEVTPALPQNLTGEPTTRNRDGSVPGKAIDRRLPPVASREPMEDDQDFDAHGGGFQRRPRDLDAQRTEPKTKQPPPQRRRIEIDPSGLGGGYLRFKFPRLAPSGD